jgi:diacylglycerol kinase family enzyme
MRLLLLVNAAASSVTERGKVVIAKALAADHDLEVAETSSRNHATKLAAEAATDGFDAVVAFGGDGTLNEAANGVARTATALAVLPGGSTNVFARTIGMPNDPVEATGALLEALEAGRIRDIGAGVVNGRRFLFHVGVGFDAAVVEQVERRAPLKRYASHPLFVYSAFTTWFLHYERLRPRFEVDGEPASFAIVLNSNPYTYLGSRPLHLLPEATLDGPLCAVRFKTMGMGPLLQTAGAALAGRDVRRSKHLDVRTDLQELAVTSDRPFPFQVDGDYVGEAANLAFRHEPAALRFIVPAGRT